MTRRYLDHASTSPARPEVVEAMLPWLTGERAADPGRVHTEGRMARAAVEDARERVAALLGARPREVVFTSGATEAINAAVFGSVETTGKRRIVAPAVEHSAVLDASARHDLVRVRVDGVGRVDAGDVLAAITADTALVHVQWGNHEVATLQPVAEVVAACRAEGVLVHVDAAQAAGHVGIDLAALGADLVSVSAHKLGGPKGIGALVVRRGIRLAPLLVGGEQERARRGGIENVPAIVGFGQAADTLATALPLEVAAQRRLTDRVLDAAATWRGVRVYGDPTERLPHIVCLGVDGVEAEAVLLGLDQAGVAAHSGSACSSESLEPSPVLEAMGVEAERSLRVSVGWSTTDQDVDAFCSAFPSVVDRLRALR
ncbi:MAG TPA: cysteine desulfurase family protein [Acidimicrobiales bacterium]